MDTASTPRLFAISYTFTHCRDYNVLVISLCIGCSIKPLRISPISQCFSQEVLFDSFWSITHYAVCVGCSPAGRRRGGSDVRHDAHRTGSRFFILLCNNERFSSIWSSISFHIQTETSLCRYPVHWRSEDANGKGSGRTSGHSGVIAHASSDFSENLWPYLGYCTIAWLKFQSSFICV